MSNSNISIEKGTDEEQDDEQRAAVEGPALRPTVALETQAKIDSETREAITAARTGEAERPFGMTLVEQERWEAREQEIGRTRTRDDRSQSAFREGLCRTMTEDEYGRERPDTEEWTDPTAGRGFAVETRRTIREQAIKLENRVDGGLTYPALVRKLADRVASGQAVADAVLELVDETRDAGGALVPLDELEAVNRREVDVQGTVETLWEPSHPSMAQVGLLSDGEARVKVTVWEKSRAPWVVEGEVVRIRGAAKSWYDGRVSLAVTGRSEILFPERERFERLG